MKSKYVKKHECVIIGGGAAGMMAAVQLAGYGIDNCIIEHTGKIGSKILQTGNGKCNFTNLNMSSEMYQNKDNRLVMEVIDKLSASLTYNAAAETRPWSDLSMNLRLKLTKSYTFSMNTSFATYGYKFDENGNVVDNDRTEWSYGRFGRFKGYSGSFSYTLNNDTSQKCDRLRRGN